MLFTPRHWSLVTSHQPMEASSRWQIEGAVNDFFTAPFWYTYMAKKRCLPTPGGAPLALFYYKNIQSIL